MASSFLKNLSSEGLLILAFAIKKNQAYLLAHPELKVSLWQKIKFFRLYKKFQIGTPLAYITGHKEFFNLDFLVTKHTLIPRPDTECLVDEAFRHITNSISHIENENDKILLIDVGTGTGCIPITILHKLQKLQDYKITAIATDISKQALRVAKKNAKKHNVDIGFFSGNLLSPILQSCNLAIFKSIVVTANLPYLKEDWWKNEPSIQQEPKSALVSDGETGLYLYEKLLQQISGMKKILDIEYWIFLEIDPRQSSEIFRLVQKYLPMADVEIIKDLSGFDRVVKIELRGSIT